MSISCGPTGSNSQKVVDTINKNTTDAATNKSGIATNKSGVATNKSNISKNAACCSQNKTDIASNKILTDRNTADLAALQNARNFKGSFTPSLATLATEYPASPVADDYWIISGVGTGGYHMVTGDLAGELVYDNDQFIYDGANWFHVSSSSALGGHTIKDDDNTFLYRNGLKFSGFEVKDDQADDSTVVIAPNTGFKNHIINGGFDIWQRGSPITPGNGKYGPDRWLAVSGAHKFTKVDSSNGMSQLQLDGAGAGTYIYNVIEGQALAGKEVTLSMNVRSGSGSIQMGINISGGSGTSYVTKTFTAGVTTRISYTFTLPAAGDGIKTTIKIGTPVAQDGIMIGDVQLELGSVATNFEVRPIGLELSLCQRYYEKGGTVSINADRDTTHISKERFKVTKRGIPSVDLYDKSGTIGYIDVAGSSVGAYTSGVTDSDFRSRVSVSTSGELESTYTWTSEAEL